jgi:hypothetical protein
LRLRELLKESFYKLKSDVSKSPFGGFIGGDFGKLNSWDSLNLSLLLKTLRFGLSDFASPAYGCFGSNFDGSWD